jgi:DNA-binding CsgD family transcriptional regulator
MQVTTRELEIINLIAEGLEYREIAGLLHIAPLTVATHRRNIMRKMQAKTSAHLIKIAFESRLINVQSKAA